MSGLENKCYQMTTLLQLVYIFNGIYIQIPTTLFKDLEESIIMFVGKIKVPDSQYHIEKQGNGRHLTI